MSKTLLPKNITRGQSPNFEKETLYSPSKVNTHTMSKSHQGMSHMLVGFAVQRHAEECNFYLLFSKLSGILLSNSP
jgi:hypothetical protein